MSQIDAKSREALVESLQSKTPVFFAALDPAITFQTFILAVKDDHVLMENRVKPRYIRQVAGAKGFTLQARMVRFKTDRIGSDGEHIIFPLKGDSVIEETRQAERYSFAADERVVTEILNPFDGETRLSKSVMDMSATGLSLSTTYESRLFRPDIFLPTIRVLIDGEPYTQAAGSVVYNRKLIDLSGQLRTQVGIKFETEPKR
jgi:hypothetical protein